jgi:hypothetical protein
VLSDTFPLIDLQCDAVGQARACWREGLNPNVIGHRQCDIGPRSYAGSLQRGSDRLWA